MASFEDFSFEDLSGEDARSDGEAWSGGYEWDETPERSAAPARRPVNGRRDRRRYAPARPSAWDVWKKVLISLAAVLLVGVIVLGVGFTYASRVAKLTTIYPNVSVNGVAVGGMTVSEAARALGDDPDRYTNAAVTVNFPTGESVTVTAQQLGLRPDDGTELAMLAYNYGRDGSMLSNWKAFQSCKSEAVDMAVDRIGTAIDEQTIQSIVQPVAAAVDEKLRATDVQIGQDQITVVKNSGTTRVDVAAVTDMIRDAFEAEDYAAIDYALPAPGTVEGSAEQATDVDALLQKAYDEVYVEPADAYYDEAANSVVDSVRGVRFDMEQAKQLWNETAEGGTVTIPLVFDEPAVTADQVVGQLYADVLAEKSTSLAGSTSARINNITLAAAAMNGTVLQPGEEFSYNACLGERTAAKGYQAAGAFSGGEHIQSIGGGICQGSSTLYYCALKANLSITERWCHQFVVGYLPRGLDATVSWGWPEFKFVNSRTYPIKIEAWVADGYLTVRILGTDVDGSYVDLTNETWEDAEHYYANSYRNVYDANGNLISSTKEAYSCYDKEEVLAARKAAQEAAQQQTQQQAATEQQPVQEQTGQAPTEGYDAPPTMAEEQFSEPVTDPAAPEVFG